MGATGPTGNGTAQFVSAYLAGTVDIPNDSPTAVVFDTELEDASGLYSPTTGELTLPAGVWEITVGDSAFEASSTGIADWVLFENGVAAFFGPSAPTSGGASLTAVVRSTGSDVFTFGMYQVSGSTQTLTGYDGPTHVWFQAVRLGS
jgi:hypothetical protein